MITEIIAVGVVLSGAAYLLYLFFRNRQSNEYVWVGPGDDPFKQAPRGTKPINDFSGEEEEETICADPEEE